MVGERAQFYTPDMLKIGIGDWDTMRAEAVPIRYCVFVEEQRVPAEIELDEHDALCIHVVARWDGIAVGTGRLLPVDSEGISHIGRMAVQKAFRSRGVGAAMLLALMDAARARGDRAIVLSAQFHALGFYRRYGYAEEGGIYLDAGIEHQSMRAVLQPFRRNA